MTKISIFDIYRRGIFVYGGVRKNKFDLDLSTGHGVQNIFNTYRAKASKFSRVYNVYRPGKI